MTSDTTPQSTGPARRTLLRGATALGVLGATGALAACGGDSSADAEVPSGGSVGDDNAGSSAAGNDSGGTSTGGTGTGGTGTGGTGSGGSGGGGFAKTTDIEPGGGKVYAQEKLVVTQPTMGEYKAFTATCTHEGCVVDKVTGDGIVCPCHGSTFSLSDGSVVKPPAAKPLEEVKITVTGTDIARA